MYWFNNITIEKKMFNKSLIVSRCLHFLCLWVGHAVDDGHDEVSDQVEGNEGDQQEVRLLGKLHKTKRIIEYLLSDILLDVENNKWSNRSMKVCNCLFRKS